MLRLSIFLFALTQSLIVNAKPDHVIVVRHAERSSELTDDPAITSEGVKRADLLAEMLGAVNVQTIITTNFRRTQETAAPLARRLGLTPVVIDMQRDAVQAHIDEVIDRIGEVKGVVLVVGHTNTVSSIVEAFSDSRPTRLCETSYSNIFIATPEAPLIRAIQLKYGKPDPAPAGDCQ